MNITNLLMNLTSDSLRILEVGNPLQAQLKLYYAQDEQTTRKYLLETVLPKFEEHQIIIIDNKRTWTAEKLKIRTRIIIPNSREDLVRKIVELKHYFSPRLKLILVDNFQYYFRDYEGKNQKISNNQRSASFLINLLKNYSMQGKDIILTGYRDPINHSRPLMEALLLYYGIPWLRIKNSNLSE